MSIYLGTFPINMVGMGWTTLFVSIAEPKDISLEAGATVRHYVGAPVASQEISSDGELANQMFPRDFFMLVE